jgi:microcystin-dependent protein
MSTVRLDDLPEVDSTQLQNNTQGNAQAQTAFMPCVLEGVTQNIRLSDLAAYRSAGTVKEIYAGSSMQVVTNVSSGISYAAFALPGAIFAYTGKTLPDGWLLCDGSAVSRSTYATLFMVVGTTYGVGDAASTFNLPDLRGRVPVGLETMGDISSSGRLTNTNSGNINGTLLGAFGGAQTHSLTIAESPLPSHTHKFSSTTTIECGQQYVDDRSSGPNGSALDGVRGTVPRAMRVDTSTAATDTTASTHSNLPPLAFLNYIIRY